MTNCPFTSSMEPKEQKQPTAIDLVTSGNSPEFTSLSYALSHSSVVGLDAEWKPNRSVSTYPTVSLLQIACRLINFSDSDELQVFLVDLQEIQLSLVYELLKHLFVSPSVIKLGFKFKQDLVFLSYTFCQRGCEPGFDRVSFSISFIFVLTMVIQMLYCLVCSILMNFGW